MNSLYVWLSKILVGHLDCRKIYLMAAGAVSGQQHSAVPHHHKLCGDTSQALWAKGDCSPHCTRERGTNFSWRPGFRCYKAGLAAYVVCPSDWKFPEHVSDSPPTLMLRTTPWIQAWHNTRNICHDLWYAVSLIQWHDLRRCVRHLLCCDVQVLHAWQAFINFK